MTPQSVILVNLRDPARAQSLPSAHSDVLPEATRVAGQVLCLPIYAGLDPDDVVSVCALLRALPDAYVRTAESIEPHEAPRWRS